MGDTRSAAPVEVLEHQLRADFEKVSLYPDVAPVLDQLHKRGYRMVTISNLVAPFGEVLEQRLGPWMTGQRLFKAAAKLLGVQPHNVLVVGDSELYDIRGAQSLDMSSVLVDRLERGGDTLSTLRPLLMWLPGPMVNRLY